MFCPPGLFSITTCLPQPRDTRSATTRATLSTPEPAGCARISLTGRSGQVWANAEDAQPASSRAGGGEGERSAVHCFVSFVVDEAPSRPAQLCHKSDRAQTTQRIRCLAQQCPADCLCRSGDAVDVVVRPHQGRRAAVAMQPCGADPFRLRCFSSILKTCSPGERGAIARGGLRHAGRQHQAPAVAR